LAWLKLKEHVFGWLGRASIRFCSSCAFVLLMVSFQVCKWDSYSLGDKIHVEYKNLGVFALIKSVILEALVHDQAQVVLINWM